MLSRQALWVALYAPLLITASVRIFRAEEGFLRERERRNIDKIASLTAQEHSTILFTLADRLTALARDGHVEFIETDRSGGDCQYPHPALSHDGLQVALVSGAGTVGACTIEIYDVLTKSPRKFIETETVPGEIAWSWDDTQIAFLGESISVLDGTKRTFPPPSKDEAGHDLLWGTWDQLQWLRDGSGFVVQLDGEVPTKRPGEFTSQPELFVVRDGEYHLVGVGWSPSVSPVSGRVAYFAGCRVLSVRPDGTGKPVPLRGSWVRNPSGALLWGLVGCGFDFPIVWSSDESRLFCHAWVSEDYSDETYLFDLRSGGSKNFLSGSSIRIKGWR